MYAGATPIYGADDAALSIMKKSKSDEEIEKAKAAKRRHEHEMEGAAGGALAGAAVGAMAGPPGVAVGTVIGGLVGAMAAGAIEKDLLHKAAVDRELDAEIGVSGGDLGAPNLLHPPASRGLYSSASAGAAGTGGSAPAEGPMQPPE